MGIQKYKNLHSLPVDEFDLLDDKIQKSFVFQGSRNWDMYFRHRNDLLEFSDFHNVILLDFESEKDFENYLANNSIIDYSFEHKYEKGVNKYFVLIDNG